ncbi:MAG: ATP-binding protein [Synergistaceae bacterium]|nr:ATP-binding protein [Synergistaceae bacterium]MBQ6738714.1 ATP-binding protein [Synergistaceae bacterium]MBR0078924.1 ATP-binding protein [Synergistaceae bacterium]MBR0234732.1 ATP-binding protein [Synergistaceae bacterium]MBR0253291.1 ATP-binding protein [Synergistaceae bacterium]
MQSVLLVYNAAADSIPVLFTNSISANNSEQIYKLIHKIIEISHENNYANGNLWQNFLTHFILSNENIFSLSCERKNPPEGSLKYLVMNDFALFMKLFNLQHQSMNIIQNFVGHEKIENYSPICEFSKLLAASKTPEEFYEYVTGFYRNYGVGMFALNKAFRLDNNRLIPVKNQNVGDVKLSDIVGYEAQKQELISNTEAFISGRPANNVLLYGDGGTGKSTSIKALLNEYFIEGLRIVEIYKHQFREILKLTGALRGRNYKFIIFIDDLSFEENESDYKYLKAIIEGGIETRPENILIYATSNRRHIVREIWKDRDDMEHNGDIHRSDTVEEKLSLASRFGIAINYSSPTRQNYHEIVKTLAKKSGLEIDEEKLISGSDRWEIRHGGMTGRAARQYVDYLLGKKI